MVRQSKSDCTSFASRIAYRFASAKAKSKSGAKGIVCIVLSHKYGNPVASLLIVKCDLGTANRIFRKMSNDASALARQDWNGWRGHLSTGDQG